jgi:hypothetical protein
MHTVHLLPSVAKQPDLELKTQPKQLLGSLLLVIALPGNVEKVAQFVLPMMSIYNEKNCFDE